MQWLITLPTLFSRTRIYQILLIWALSSPPLAGGASVSSRQKRHTAAAAEEEKSGGGGGGGGGGYDSVMRLARIAAERAASDVIEAYKDFRLKNRNQKKKLNDR